MKATRRMGRFERLAKRLAKALGSKRYVPVDQLPPVEVTVYDTATSAITLHGRLAEFGDGTCIGVLSDELGPVRIPERRVLWVRVEDDEPVEGETTTFRFLLPEVAPVTGVVGAKSDLGNYVRVLDGKWRYFVALRAVARVEGRVDF